MPALTNNQIAFGKANGATPVAGQFGVVGDLAWGYRAVTHANWSPASGSANGIVWQMGPDQTIDKTDFYVIAKDIDTGWSAPITYYQSALVSTLVPVGCVSPNSGNYFTSGTTQANISRWSASALIDHGGYPNVIGGTGYDWTAWQGPQLKTAFDVGAPNTPMYFSIRKIGTFYVPNGNYPIALGAGRFWSYDDAQGWIRYQITSVNTSGTTLGLSYVDSSMDLASAQFGNPFWQPATVTNVSGTSVADIGSGDLLSFKIESPGGYAWERGGKGGNIGGTVHFWSWGRNGTPAGVPEQTEVRNFAVIMGVASPGDSFATCGSKLQTAGYWCNWLEI